MNGVRALILVAAALAPVPAVWAAGRSVSLEATITDTYNFEMRLKDLTFNGKPPPGAGTRPLKFDHIRLRAGGKFRNLWLAQIATARFLSKGKGRVEVAAVLQGEGDLVGGVVEKATEYFFAGQIAAGVRKGRRVRVPLVEARALEVHTKYEGTTGLGKAATIIPGMPGAGQDVLWVSSVPLGAVIHVKPFDCPAAQVWKEYLHFGKTPLMRELGPGKYAVKVRVPGTLAGVLRPSTKLGEGSIPFENDYWGEAAFRQGENVLESVTYTVIKREGKAAVLIALFQPKGLKLAEVVAGFPKGHNFHFAEKELEQALQFQRVPKADIALIIEAVQRGGKIIWHGPTKSLMITATPGPLGWKLGGAMRPKK